MTAWNRDPEQRSNTFYLAVLIGLVVLQVVLT